MIQKLIAVVRTWFGKQDSEFGTSNLRTLYIKDEDGSKSKISVWGKKNASFEKVETGKVYEMRNLEVVDYPKINLPHFLKVHMFLIFYLGGIFKQFFFIL